MAPETISYPKSRLASISLFISLALHSMLMVLQLYWFHSQPPRLMAPRMSHPPSRPIMLLPNAPYAHRPSAKQPVRRPMEPIARPANRILPQPSAPLVMPPAPHAQAPFPQHLKIIDAGTSMHAPTTTAPILIKDQDLSALTPRDIERLSAKNMPPVPTDFKAPLSRHGGYKERSPMSAPRPTLANMPHPAPANKSHGPKPGIIQRIPGRLPLFLLANQDDRPPAEPAVTSDQEATDAIPADTVPADLSFLNPNRTQAAMKERLLSGTDDTPGNTNGLAERYGNPVALIYNTKLSKALRHAGAVVRAEQDSRIINAIAEEVKRPTEIDFSLSQKGSVISAHVRQSSGNQIFDHLGLRMVQQALFPPIPASLGFKITHHRFFLHSDAISFDPNEIPSVVSGE